MSDKKTIVFVIDFYFNDSGYNTRVLSELEILHNNHVNVHLILLSKLSQLVKLKRWKVARHILCNFRKYTDTVSFIPYKVNPMWLSKNIVYWGMLFYLRRKCVVCIYAESTLASFYSEKFSIIKKKYLITDLHGIGSEEVELLFDKKPNILNREKLLQELFESATMRSDYIVCVSHSMVRYIESRYGYPCEQTMVLPCSVSSSHINQRWLEYRMKSRNDLKLEGDFVLGYLGGIQKYQLIKKVILLYSSIIKKRPNVKLLIITDIVNHDYIRSMVDNPDNLILVSVDHKDVIKILPAMDVGLLLRDDHPTNNVSSPTKFGEYLGSGVPVISVDYIGDLKEYITSMEIGLLLSHPPTTASEDILEYLDYVSNNRELIAKKCINWVNNNYSWSSKKEIFYELISRYMRH